MLISSTIYNSQNMGTIQVPLNNKWLASEDMLYICTGILLSHKKNEILPYIATQMSLENIILSEINQIKTNII